MLSDFHVWVVRIERLFIDWGLSFQPWIGKRDGKEPNQKDRDAGPDNFDIPGEGLSELALRALDDSEHFDGGSVETKPSKWPQSVAVFVWNVLVPFLGSGQRTNSPKSYSEFKQIVLSWNPENKLQEKVVAVNDQDERNESYKTKKALEVLQTSPFKFFQVWRPQLI